MATWLLQYESGDLQDLHDKMRSAGISIVAVSKKDRSVFVSVRGRDRRDVIAFVSVRMQRKFGSEFEMHDPAQCVRVPV